MNGKHTILWLEDQMETIEDLADHLRKTGNFDINVIEDPEEALNALKSQNPDLFAVDLSFDKNDGNDRSIEKKPKDVGIETAKTVWSMKPSIPIVAITEYLDKFSYDIASSIAKQNYPFAAIWEKGRLVEESGKELFSKQLHLLCQPYYQSGEVVKIESDFTEIALRTPDGKEYRRFFESNFLEICGINEIGDKVGVLFWKMADSGAGHVYMRIKRLSRSEDVSPEKIREIISGIDMEKVRDKFRATEKNH